MTTQKLSDLLKYAAAQNLVASQHDTKLAETSFVFQHFRQQDKLFLTVEVETLWHDDGNHTFWVYAYMGTSARFPSLYGARFVHLHEYREQDINQAFKIFEDDLEKICQVMRGQFEDLIYTVNGTYDQVSKEVREFAKTVQISEGV